MSVSSRTRRAGFTLIELMVAILILTIILGMVYGAYASVVDSIAISRAASQRLVARQFIQRNLGQNLAQASEGWSPGAAYRSAGTEGAGAERGIMRYPFLGAQATSGNGPADELTFVSSAPMIGAAGMPGSVKLCTYEITEPESERDASEPVEAEAETLLTITEMPWVEPGLGEEQRFTGPGQAMDLVGRAADRVGVEPVTVSIPVYAWELAYFDGKEWVETWDGQQMGRLPWSVRVRVKVAPTDDAFAESLELDPETDPDVIELVVPVPAGAGIHDAPPDYVRPGDRETT